MEKSLFYVLKDRWVRIVVLLEVVENKELHPRRPIEDVVCRIELEVQKVAATYEQEEMQSTNIEKSIYLQHHHLAFATDC
jgi:hypothetical protein